MAGNVVQNGRKPGDIELDSNAAARPMPYENGTEKTDADDEADLTIDNDGDRGDVGSDPEVKAELQYAKDHGLNPSALPIRQKLRLLKRAKSMEGKKFFVWALGFWYGVGVWLRDYRVPESYRA